ncbi:v-myb avian myeloblastosis viral oncogene homolog-like 2a isoform X3 [Takifugu rubripes]|nr:uncharacterized protein LOC101066328 isoform X3 [Takifugu rubripes]
METEKDSIIGTESDSDTVQKKDGTSCEVKWTEEEDENLKILTNNFGKSDWKTIASLLPGRTEVQCMQRWNMHLDPTASKSYWTKDEDEKIAELVTKYGTINWPLISKHMIWRTAKQCRERWQNHLDPQIKKSAWTTEEELIVYKAHLVLGNRWTEIAKLIPGRSDVSVKNHWKTIKKRAQMGFYRDEADSISLDIQQFVKEEVDFKCDVVLDTGPVTPKVFKSVNKKKVVEVKQETVDHAPQRAASRGEISTASPPLPTSLSSSPNSSSGAAPVAAPVDQKRFAEAALKMIAEDMLPLSFVEGTGFRSFMNTISPEYSKLSQRALGLQLYDEVERTIKPQLIRDLKARLAKDGENAIHVTLDLWVGNNSNPVEDPILVVCLHFVNESWQVRRPTVAFRHLGREDLRTAVARELEAVLLSYGIFPNNIGVVLTNQAKETLAKNSVFCNYKVTCSSNRGDPDADEMVAFVSDQISETDSLFSELQIGTKTTCAAAILQLVIKEALKNSRVVENLLLQVQNVVAFFRSSGYWSEILFRECNVSLCPSSSGHRWNSMMISLRRMVQESAWSKVMSVLAQARIEASDAASAPPLIMVKREQVLDILAHLEPFCEAIQVLQRNGVTVSYIIPSLIGLDKTLETLDTNYAHFNRALRTGLCSHFRHLIHQNEMIVAAVLDPRIKLQPFSDKLEEHKEFLMPPSKCQARTIVEARLGSPVASAAPEEAGEDQVAKEEGDVQEEKRTDGLVEASVDSSDEMAEGDDLKRKSIFNFLQPPAKAVKMSELDVYLSEPLVEGNSSLSYWKSAIRFPQLQRLSKKLLAVPTTSGGFDRLYPMAACIVRAKRNHLPPHTTERLLLYKNSFKTKVVRKSSGATKHWCL